MVWFSMLIVLTALSSIVLLTAIGLGRDADQQELSLVQGSYIRALRALRIEPTNATLRQRAFIWGRAYAVLTREQEYDTLALVRDMAAASAPRSPAPTTDLLLCELDQLRIQGMLGDHEYQQYRSAVICDKTA